MSAVDELRLTRGLLDKSGVDPMGFNHLTIAQRHASCGKDALLALINVQAHEPWWGTEGKTPIIPASEMLSLVDRAVHVAEQHPNGWGPDGS
jgi:hypothetical protein